MGAGNSVLHSSSDDDSSLDEIVLCTNDDHESMCDSYYGHEDFILSAVYPELKSYTCDDPTYQQLLCLNVSSADINCFPHMLNFDCIFFGGLSKYGDKCPFASEDYAFQKQFLTELLALLICPEDNHEVLEWRAKIFVRRWAVEGVTINECKSSLHI